MSASIERAGELLRTADGIVVLTGAGMSAESGVPTFRGEQGLWRSYRPEQLATPEAFRRDPVLVWSWYRWRRGLVGACKPNPGHEALARFALGRGDVKIVTQNVDGLHQRAALDAAVDSDATRAFPTELHGSLLRDLCSGCGRRTAADIPTPEASAHLADPETGDAPAPPRCERCQSLLRPDVVWFGEALDAESLEGAFTSAADSDVCLVVGTSSLVYPAAGVPRAALGAGRRVIELNLDETPLTGHATVSIRGRAGELLPRLLAV